MTKKEMCFNAYRFKGLDAHECSNNYLTMKRINDTRDKVVIKVADCHLLRTQYGFMFLLDNTHVLFLKFWQVDKNYFGNEILIDKDYFKPKEYGQWADIEQNDEALNFDFWLKIADEQKETKVRWKM